MLKPMVVEEPETVAVATGVPLASKVSWVMLEGFPLPETDTVTLFIVTLEEPLLLVKSTCCTGMLLAPGSCVEEAGGLLPWLTVTVTGVRVAV